MIRTAAPAEHDGLMYLEMLAESIIDSTVEAENPAHWELMPEPVEGDYPFRWQGYDFHLPSGASVRCVVGDIDCPIVDVYVFDARRMELAKARLDRVNGPAAVALVVALIASVSS